MLVGYLIPIGGGLEGDMVNGPQVILAITLAGVNSVPSFHSIPSIINDIGIVTKCGFVLASGHEFPGIKGARAQNR
jgi:hypothetical protein